MRRLLPLLALLLIKFVDCKDAVVVYFSASDDTSGLVRIWVNGSPISSSRTICWDTSWGLEEANVTCRQMGFLKATSTGKVSDSAIAPILFDVRCSGTETNLADCSYSLTGSCSQSVSVTCLQNPAFNGLFDVRLNGLAAHKGIVEVRPPFRENTKEPWYAQCYHLWSKEDSEVVCRQLGYSGVKATTRVIGSLPNVTDGEIRCTGTEQTLEGCRMIPTKSCTDKRTYPQVECHLDSATQQLFDIRLTGGNTSAGSVELLKYGRWGVICDRKEGYWDLASARVVCQQLGFVDAIRVTEPAEFGQGSGSIHLKNPACQGDEWSIEKCPIPHGWGGGVKACQTKDTAGVVCSPEQFPSYDINSAVYTPNASESFGRFFLHSPGFPQLFSYTAHTHLICTMTTDNITEISLYIHCKRFQENHSETLSFQANDTQATSSTFYRLQLYGNDSDPGPYTTNTTSLTMEFKSNDAKGSGKFRLEIRVRKSADVSLNCSTQTPTPTSSTSTTSVTPQGINTPVTTTVMVTNTTTTDMTAGSTTGGFTEPITTPITTPVVSLTTDQTNSTTIAPAPSPLSADVVVAGLVGASIVAIIAIILGVVLWKLGLVRFGKRQSPRPESDTRGGDHRRIEFTGIGNGSPAYENVGTEYVNDAFVPDVASPYDYVESNTFQRPEVTQGPALQGNDGVDASPYSNVRELGQDVARENQSDVHGQVPEAPYDEVTSSGPHSNTTESNAAESSSNQARGGHGLTQSLSNDDAPHISVESPYAPLDPVNRQEYLDFRELSQEQLRPI